MTYPITREQHAALYAAGHEIGTSWCKNASTSVCRDWRNYDFAGDWQHVRSAARKAGIAWDATADQPDDDVRAAVWAAARAGYRDALIDNGID